RPPRPSRRRDCPPAARPRPGARSSGPGTSPGAESLARLGSLPTRGRRWGPSWGARSSAERSRNDRGGMRPADGLGLRTLLEVVHDRGPDLPVVPDLVLEVVLAEKAGERRLADRVPASRETAGIVAEHGEVVLKPGRHVALDHEERRRVLPVEHRHVVDLEDPLELLDRRRVLVDSQVDPAVVPPAVAAPL